MMPTQLWVGAAALSVAAGFASGWTVRDWKADSAALKAVGRTEQQRIAMQASLDHQGDRFEALRQSIEPQRGEVRSRIREIYRNVEVPADCALRPDALGVLNAALKRANAATAGESGEPMSDAARASAANGS